MWWQVRALLEDRPGALAALATRCVQDAVVTPCSPHVLEDQPVRYLRAVQQVMQKPESLRQELYRLLDAEPGACTLVVDDDAQPVTLTRSYSFTDTEGARARELSRLAAFALSTGEAVVPVAGAPVSLRRGTAADVRGLRAMHGRCSAETVSRRFHAPMPHLNPRTARGLLEPVGGFSMVLTVGDAVIACGTVAPADDDTLEIGLVVEDGWQRRGHGARLLAALVDLALKHGAETLTCYVQPDNEAALGAIRRAGLRAHASHVDGVTVYRIVRPGVPTDPPGAAAAVLPRGK